MFTSYPQVMDHLHHLGLFHMDLTLHRVIEALHRLGLERTPFAVAHVVGTNGKGSTATFLASLAQAHGLRAGLFTSPHFVSPAERVRIDGAPLAPERWPSLANAVMAAGPDLTYFEFLTVLAVLAFVEAGVECAVMEAGLGGRWDATTALHADILCVTPIDLDHQAILGDTLAAIAADKAGALRPGETAILARQHPEVLHALEAAAQEKGATLLQAMSMVPLPEASDLGLYGQHQRGNAQVALAAWRVLAEKRIWPASAESEAQALRNAFIPGRLQWIAGTEGHPPFLLDGAHNAHGMRALVAAVRESGVQPSAVIFSSLADKDLDAVLPLLLELAGSTPIFVPTIADNTRAASGPALAARISPKAQAVPALTNALRLVAQLFPRQGVGPVLICGSLYLLGEFFALHPEYLAAPDRREAL